MDKEKYEGLIVSQKEIFTIYEAAKFLDVSNKTVYEHVSTKREPGKIFAKKIGRVWRIQKKDIYRYLDEENELKK